MLFLKNGEVKFQVVFVSLDDELDETDTNSDLNYTFVDNDDSFSNKLLNKSKNTDCVNSSALDS